MTEEKFEMLISSEESRIIDFKREQYKLLNGNTNDLSKFIKDIVSFCNTVRDDSAYIIIGIEEQNGEKIFHGLNEHIDDAIFQEKIKDKVYPRPNFSYYSFLYESKRYGIIEIPLESYSAPITATISGLKGLEVGKIYFRRGTSNSEANGIESININEWITSVVPRQRKNQINDSIVTLISKISASEYFSPHISESLSIGKQLNNSELINFCVFELTAQHDEAFNLEHRLMDCFMSTIQIIRTNYPQGTPVSQLWTELRQNDDFWESKINIGDPVNQIEAQLRNFRTGEPNQFISLERKVRHFLGESASNPEAKIHVYWGEQNMASLYERSKQKLIQLLTNAIV